MRQNLPEAVDLTEKLHAQANEKFNVDTLAKSLGIVIEPDGIEELNAGETPRVSVNSARQQATRLLDKSYFGFDVVEIYKEVLKDKEVLDLLEQIFIQSYTKFLGPKGRTFIKEYFRRLHALRDKALVKELTLEEIKHAFLELRELFTSSGLKPSYYGDFRRDNLRKSVELAGADNFHGYVVDLGADDNALGEVILELYGNQIQFVEGIDIEKRNNVREGPKLGFKIQDKDSQVLPIDDNKADVVIIRYALHHMSLEQQENFLKEAKRILKPGGRLLIYEDTYSTKIVPIDSDQYRFHEKLMKLRDSYRMKLFLAANDTFSHGIKDKNQPFPFTYRTIEEWEQLFSGLGFKRQRMQYFGIPIYDLHQAPFGIFVFLNDKPQESLKDAAGVDSLASSSVVSTEIKSPGGIDFRATMPNIIQLQGQPILNEFKAWMSAPLANINLTEEWSQMQGLLGAGISPSIQRIKEYSFACYQRRILNNQIGKILGCIADKARAEEDQAVETDLETKQLLALLGAVKM